MAKSARPPGKQAPDGRMKLLGIVAIVAAALLLAAIVLFVVLSLARSREPLPASPATRLPDLPNAPGLPQINPRDQDVAPLPQTNVPAIPQAPVTGMEPRPEPPRAPEPSGTVTWRWQLCPVSPSILGQQIQGSMPNYQFVALGVTIYNETDYDVPVDNNAFSVTVDGKLYRSDQFSTADAVINGLPFLAPTVLKPGATVSGQTAFMIPRVSNRIEANWQVNLPRGIKVVRVDPASPIVPSQQGPMPQQPTAGDWGE